MKALVVEKTVDAARLLFKDVIDPLPVPGEALIKVGLAGLCRTDQELVKGCMDFAIIPFKDASSAFKTASAPDSLKVLLDFNQID